MDPVGQHRPPSQGTADDLRTAHIGQLLDFAHFGVTTTAELTAIPEYTYRADILVDRAHGHGNITRADTWPTWVMAGKPGYVNACAAFDRLPPDMYADLSQPSPIASLVAIDLTRSPVQWWSLAADLVDLAGLLR